MMFPLKMSEITAATVRKLDVMGNSYIHKWFRIPRCLSGASLFGRNTLQLELKNSTPYFKLKMSRLVLEPIQSSDHHIRTADATLRPNIILGSTMEKRVILIKLTVPWEQGIQDAYERKKSQSLT